MSGRATLPCLDGVGPHVKLRLDVAARLASPDGTLKLSSLRREAAKGNLTVWRVANKTMTTLAEIERMFDRCRVQSSPPAYGCDLPKESDPPYGSSSMEDGSSAQAAARMRALKLKGSFKSTLPASTMPRRAAGVVQTRRG